MSASITGPDGSGPQTLTEADLRQFTGTENIYRHGLVRHIRYTDGAQHVAEAGQAYWLLDAIACSQLEPKIAAEPFQLWTLTVHEDRSADLRCTDGNGIVIKSERIAFTDFPLKSIDLYCTDNTILLPNEY
jgi:hypothetical protein